MNLKHLYQQEGLRPSGWYGSRSDMGYDMKMRSDMGRGLIWGMVWKLPYYNLFIIHFLSDKFAYFDIVCGVKRSKVRPPSAPNVVIRFFFFFLFFFLLLFFFARAKKPYHPRDLVIWVFITGKKAVSPIITPFELHKSAILVNIW